MAAMEVAALEAEMEKVVMEVALLDGSPVDRRGVRPENDPEVGLEEVVPATAGLEEGVRGRSMGVPVVVAVVGSPEVAPASAAVAPKTNVSLPIVGMVTAVHGVRMPVEKAGTTGATPNKIDSAIGRSRQVRGSAVRIVFRNDDVPEMNAVSHRIAPEQRLAVLVRIAMIDQRRRCSRKPQLLRHRPMTLSGAATPASPHSNPDARSIGSGAHLRCEAQQSSFSCCGKPRRPGFSLRKSPGRDWGRSLVVRSTRASRYRRLLRKPWIWTPSLRVVRILESLLFCLHSMA